MIMKDFVKLNHKFYQFYLFVFMKFYVLKS